MAHANGASSRSEIAHLFFAAWQADEPETAGIYYIPVQSESCGGRSCAQMTLRPLLQLSAFLMPDGLVMHKPHWSAGAREFCSFESA